MSCLQNMRVTTHHEQQQALDLSFGDADTIERVENKSKSEASNYREEPLSLIPIVRDGHQLMKTRSE